VPIGEASFWLRGTKTIGKDALGNPVYKYSQKNNLDAAGRWQAMILVAMPIFLARRQVVVWR